MVATSAGTVLFAATKTWWYLSRSTGIVAWALLALSVLWGLALSTRALGRKPTAPWLLDVHRFLSGLAIAFTVVHLVGLMLDPYVSFTIPQLLVPFASDWKPGAVAWGVVALYLLLLVEITSLLRRRIPNELWHRIHLLSYVLYAAATIHLLTAGTDRTNSALRWIVIASVGAVVFFTSYRIVGPGRAESVKTSGRAKD